MLRNTLTTIFMAAALCAGAQRAPQARDISTYVFPGNRAEAPANMTFLSDGTAYALLSADGKRIVTYDLDSGKELETIFDVANTRETTITNIEGFILSPDASKIMVYNNSEKVYRHSFTAEYYVYDRRSRILRPLSTDHKPQRAPLFSPDSRMVAFTAANNIFIRKLDYNTEVAVTTDGKINEIINGIPDWSYEEEFSVESSMAWAPDNQMLCYLKYNEKEVPTYSLTLYEGACNPMKEYALYPGSFTYKYPVAGQKNSLVTLHSYDVDNRKNIDIALPDQRIEYIPSIQFGGSAPDRLIVTTLNRDQNRLEIYSVNPRSTVARSLYVEESKTWIIPATYEKLRCEDDGFVVLSAKSGFNNLYKYTYAGALNRQLTQVDYDITDYYGTDAAGTVYFQAATPQPRDRALCSIDRKGVVKIHSTHGGSDQYHGTTSVNFAPTMKRMVVNYSNAATPPRYTVADPAGKTYRTLVDNASYAARYASMPRKEFISIPSADPALAMSAYIIKPVDFDPAKRYPVVMYQYSGPDSQQVSDAWRPDWDYYFATQGYIIICADGRGTGYRGRAYADVVYRNLGHYETLDQKAAAQYAKSLPYVDPARVGIFGWSYGGYEALMCATSADCPWAAVCAVAPVTDWRLYDSIYTERYMRTPQQNEQGYNDSAPLKRANKLNIPLLIMHGTADDNVHPANTMEFVSRLQTEGILCQMLMFPNMNHSIYGCNSRSMVYAAMLQFFNEKLR